MNKNILHQILGGLMQKPQLLGEIDKYSLDLSDFSERFERYIFMAIKQLYIKQVTTIQPIDIYNCLESNTTAKKIFENNHGI